MDPIMGTIILFAGSFAPRGWMFCNGQQLAISSNSALFSILGTTYGGNGTTTFNLPDLRGRVPVGTGSGGPLPVVQAGQAGGNNNVTLLQSNMPSHTHTATLRAEGAVSTAGNPTGNMLGIITGDTKVYATPNPASEIAMGADSIVVAPAGGNMPFNIQNPYLGLNYIIATEGVYPSRN